MATNKQYTVQKRRKREGKTDYTHRLTLIKSKNTRFTIRKTQKHTIIQLIQYTPEGDNIAASTNTQELKKLGWKGATANTPAAYLTGMLAAKKAKEKNITTAVSDLGFTTSVKGAIIYAAIKGANDNGLTITCSKNMYPDEQRINGTQIAQFAKKLKQENKQAYEKQFSTYLKNSLDPETLPQHFQTIMKLIKGVQ
ncbi:50S ribosomal protein L18 [Candidatus Woesearchaeota archaeon]|nr:50S ribosomal protein L18 [Candidatus Woesearchaeota archaeon]